MAIYELLIRGNPDGSLAGAHQVDWIAEDRQGPPKALDPTAISALLGESFPTLADDLIAARERIAELEAQIASGAQSPRPPEESRVTMFQAREALRRTPSPQGGTLLDRVNAYVEAHKDDQPTLGLAWEYATHVERRGAFVNALAAHLGFSDTDLDALFAAAADVDA